MKQQIIYGLQSPLIGRTLYGYCGGAFGRVYSDKVIALVGPLWVVAIDGDGDPCIAHFDNTKRMQDDLQEWMTAEKESFDRDEDD